MKSKKSLLVALVLALCIVIGCTATSCRSSSANNQQGSDVAPTIIVTRPDYSGDIKVYTIYKQDPNIDEFTNLVNEWLENNRDKTIVDIDYQFFLTPSMWASTATIIYRENEPATTEE